MMNPSEIANYISRTDAAVNSFEAQVLECQSTRFPERFPFEEFFRFVNTWRQWKAENDGYLGSLFDSIVQSATRNSEVVRHVDFVNMSLITYRNQFILECGTPTGDVPRMEGLEDTISDGRQVAQLQNDLTNYAVGGAASVGKIVAGVALALGLGWAISRR